MKKINIIVASLVLAIGIVGCDNQLDITNPNNQTSLEFGSTDSELEEAMVACYNRIRLEGTFARVGYTMDAVRGDEVWNASQIWYLPYDNLNAAPTDEIGNQWIWRDCYEVINRTNFVLYKTPESSASDEKKNQFNGQAYFLRGLAYYTLVTYQQSVPLITSYEEYVNAIDGKEQSTIDECFDLIESDFKNAMELLPSRNEGGQWAQGRATCGAAAGYYARALMFRHKFSEALTVLKDIIDGKYGSYKLMDDYGDNCKEGTAYENNDESLFEVQFMDYGTSGTIEEWTPVNRSINATQQHAVESNYGPYGFGSWADLAASPWLYQLFKSESSSKGINGSSIDPRLYWTLNTYEADYGDYNMVYQTKITSSPASNSSNGGISIAKCTNSRNNLYNTITCGLRCGNNLRLMRYSDVLLRAAECENEVNGPTQQAIDWINQVRNRAGLANLNLSDFNDADKLFEQIANVERPKEFGCENGRGIDLIRWGFFYDSERFAQISQHSCWKSTPAEASTEQLTTSTADDYSYKYYVKGHEYFPIALSTLNANTKLVGNSANKDIDNSTWFFGNGWKVRPVVNLSK